MKKHLLCIFSLCILSTMAVEPAFAKVHFNTVFGELTSQSSGLRIDFQELDAVMTICGPNSCFDRDLHHDNQAGMQQGTFLDVWIDDYDSASEWDATSITFKIEGYTDQTFSLSQFEPFSFVRFDLQLEPQPRSFPYREDFSNGLPASWQFSSTETGRIVALNGRLEMDDTVRDGEYALNEAILTVDLAGQSNVVLQVDLVDFRDEEHTLPASFVDSFPGDGIAVSSDGVNWFTVLTWKTSQDVTQSKVSILLDTVVAANPDGLEFTSNFHIKFQQYDNNAKIGKRRFLGRSKITDGRGFDNIVVKQETGPTLNDAWKLTDDTGALFFTQSVGDVNGDAIDDLAVGLPAHIIAGPITKHSSVQEATYAYVDTFRVRESIPVGDLNSDGIVDFLFRDFFAGDWLLLHGPISPGPIPVNEPDARFVFSTRDAVASGSGGAFPVGDFNGDGVDDVWIRTIPEGSEKHTLDLHLGKQFAGPTNVANSAATIRLGDISREVHPVDTGNFNGDEHMDIVVGSPRDNAGAGAVRIYYGPISGELLPEDADVFISGNPGSAIGLGVYNIGDRNGDGSEDLAITTDPQGPASGHVYVMHSSPLHSGSVNGAFATLIGEPSESLGTNIALLGDIDGDGLGDFAITSSGQFAGADATGAVYVVSGPIAGPLPISVAATAKYLGTVGEKIGINIATGDFDGDHLIDLAVSSVGNAYVLPNRLLRANTSRE